MTKHKPQSFEIKNRSLLSKFFKRNTILSERNVSVHFRFFWRGVGGGISPRLSYVYYNFAVTSKLAVALADNILLNGAMNALTN